MKKNLAGAKGVSSTPVALIYTLLPAVLLITSSVLFTFPVLEGITFSEAMSVGIHHQEGIVFINEGRYEEALEAFDKALEIYPEFKLALDNKEEALGYI
ncbi:MAG: tetratricopeptide repeat protein [Halobacteriota archaeon]|nr:tetratricopeptide repeat protein [Halobacteriota archaeon]